ncbi:MAG TPA: hypothetical protein PLI66_06655, partial [Spirochaetales bacterium]|nr:hypothetical protein [Spirochaetales bacterium]
MVVDCAAKALVLNSSLCIAPLNCEAILVPLCDSSAACVLRASSLCTSSADKDCKVLAVVDKVGSEVVDGSLSCAETVRAAKSKTKPKSASSHQR